MASVTHSNEVARGQTADDEESEAIPLLPESVPVAMPELPPRLTLTTREQMKAIGDPTRSRMLVIIQNQPATAKQIADRLGVPPGTIGHHLQVLEAAGLARMIARRQVRGTVAKYYVRTARLFIYDLPHEVAQETPPSLDIVRTAYNELADALLDDADETDEPDECATGFPHARLSLERATAYAARLKQLSDEFAAEPPDPHGQIYGLLSAFFVSPAYVQVTEPGVAATPDTDRETTVGHVGSH